MNINYKNYSRNARQKLVQLFEREGCVGIVAYDDFSVTVGFIDCTCRLYLGGIVLWEDIDEFNKGE